MPDTIEINTEISNEVVDIVLDDNESVTVPDGEVWVVTFTLCDVSDNNDPNEGTDQTLAHIDGISFIYSSNSGKVNTTKTVVKSGQEITLVSDGQGAVHIGGFVVDKQ